MSHLFLCSSNGLHYTILIAEMAGIIYLVGENKILRISVLVNSIMYSQSHEISAGF